MSKKDKALSDFQAAPAPKWSDVTALLTKFGYKSLEMSGSRVRFVRKATKDTEHDSVIMLHKPHPQNTIKAYVKKDILTALKMAGLIK